MSDGDGFGVDVAELRTYSGALGRLADRGKALAKTLAAVTANTGRGDSDQMGRLGPTDISEEIDDIAGEMVDDTKLISERADLYEEIDKQSSDDIANTYYY